MKDIVGTLEAFVKDMSVEAPPTAPAESPSQATSPGPSSPETPQPSEAAITHAPESRSAEIPRPAGRPPGLLMLDEVEKIRKLLLEDREQEANQAIDAACQAAKAGVYPKPNIFEELRPEAIRLILGKENLEQGIHEAVIKSAEYLVERMDTTFSELTSDDVVREPPSETRLSSVDPYIMDHTCREPATTTPFGHTAKMKLQSLDIVRQLDFKDMAVSGMYYGDMYTVEEQFMELLYDKHGDEGMSGCFVMCGPAAGARRPALDLVSDPVSCCPCLISVRLHQFVSCYRDGRINSRCPNSDSFLFALSRLVFRLLFCKSAVNVHR